MAEDDTSPSNELRTPYVFFDTQAYVAHRFDWNGAVFKKISDFGKSGVLKPLVTNITKREVRSHLREHAADARNRLQKSEPILQQLGVTSPFNNLNDVHDTLCKRFEEFLARSKTTEIPAPLDATEILEDYFAGKPPFGSGKKKSEFPDAFVIAGLRKWCEATRHSVYIISGDLDLAACCNAAGPLILLQTIQQLLSLAVVNHDTRQKLLEAVKASKDLAEMIRRSVEDRMSDTTDDDVEIDHVSIDRVDVIDANVIDGDRNNFVLEIEAEVELSGEIRHGSFEHTTIYHSPYVRPHVSFVSFGSVQYIYPQVQVTFDPNDPSSLSIDDIGLYSYELKIELDRHSDFSDLPREIRLRIR